mmetsp:Transcript_45868/g.132837  ORF Transcript_45868/g.132837 Transcript_45868/m.132837 type:complete len:587 (-) Transcript_45868:145-1905(-)
MAWPRMKGLPASLLAALLAPVPGSVLECPPGSGFQGGVGICTLCRPGSWGNGSGACTACPAGRASAEVGVREASGCLPCALGRWSGEPGAALEGSCRGCPAGRYGVKEGASSWRDCQECPVGTFNILRAAVSKGSCRACVAGRFGDRPGAEDMGACTRCPAGKWSNTSGANSSGTCRGCPVGSFLSGSGAASPASCAACPAGRYSSRPGAVVCSPCPRGTWAGSRSASACRACAPGRWTPAPGAISAEECTECENGLSCGEGGVARVEMRFEGLDQSVVPAAAQNALMSAYVNTLAVAARVGPASVLDLRGRTAAATLAGASGVQASLLLPPGASPGALAAALSAPALETSMREIAAALLGTAPSGFSVEVRPGVSQSRREPSSDTMKAQPEAPAVLLPGRPDQGAFSVDVQPETLPLSPGTPGHFSVEVRPEDSKPGKAGASMLVVAGAPGAADRTGPGALSLSVRPALRAGDRGGREEVASAVNRTQTRNASEESEEMRQLMKAPAADRTLTSSNFTAESEDNLMKVEGHKEAMWWFVIVLLFVAVVMVCVVLDSYEAERKRIFRGGRYTLSESDDNSEESSQE